MNPLSSPLLTDLYQLTMLQGLPGTGHGPARRGRVLCAQAAESRNFLVAAGLEQERWISWRTCASAPRLQVDRGKRPCSRIWWTTWRSCALRETCMGIPEGTVVFANEPLLRVTAALPPGPVGGNPPHQFAALLHHDDRLQGGALGARRAGQTAGGFRTQAGPRRGSRSARRAGGLRGGIFPAARATVPAAPCFGVPVYGTMAHSFVQAHDDEGGGVRALPGRFRATPCLLIDTYDTGPPPARRWRSRLGG